MGNSTKTLRDAVDYAQSFPDLDAVIPASGYSVKMVCQIATAVMAKMFSSALKWPWNRKEFAAFVTNSWQQDYATNTVDVGFIFDSHQIEINNTMTPKPIWPLEANQLIPVTSQSFGRPGQISVMLNRDLQYASWGAANTSGQPGPNPQPLTQIINPSGAGSLTPNNPYTQIVDTLGQFWQIFTFGTTGATNPFLNYNLVLTSVANASAGSTVYTGTITGGGSNAFAGLTFQVAGFTNAANNGTWICTASSTTTLTLSNAAGASETHAATVISPPTPVFPSFIAPTTVATTCTDGSVVWTAVNPVNFGWRLTPLPTQTGVPYQVWPIYQMRPTQFTATAPAGSMNQTLDPIPDDFAQFFFDGFIAMLYARHPDVKLRAKHADSVALWEKSLLDAHHASDRTRDNAIMYPSQGVMQNADAWYPNAAMPYGPPY